MAVKLRAETIPEASQDYSEGLRQLHGKQRRWGEKMLNKITFAFVAVLLFFASFIVLITGSLYASKNLINCTIRSLHIIL